MTKLAKRKMNRSGTQACPVCGQVRPLVEHHIRGRDIPNAELPCNKAWLCPACHDEVHIGLVILEGWFSTSHGRQLFWHRQGEPALIADAPSPPLYRK